MKKQKNIILLIISVLIVLFISISLSYAYFSAGLEGVEEDTTITVIGGSMKIIYDSGANINVGGMTPSNQPFAVKTFTVTGNNTTDIEMYYQISLIIDNNTFSNDALKYKLISSNINDNGSIVESKNYFVNIGTGPKIINLGVGSFQSPTGGSKVHSYDLELYFLDTGENQNIDQGKNIKAYISVNNHQPTLSEKTISQFGGVDKIKNKGEPDFHLVSEINEGLFYTEDDYGDSFYYRGAVDNNWVYFNNMYWRIIRITGNNLIKIIFSGTTPPSDSEKVFVTEIDPIMPISTFNELSNQAEYTGYMYTIGQQRGFDTSSDIKNTLESWYQDYLIEQDDQIADVIFCNDRSTYVGTIGGRYHDGNGIGNTPTWFGASRRLISELEEKPLGTGPSLICPHKDDAFTKYDNILGNAKLSEKIGLLTADEAAMAGLVILTENKNNYLFTGYRYWFLSPHLITANKANVFDNHVNGYLNTNYVFNEFVNKPVIALIDSVKATGTGAWNDPYAILD